MRTKQNYTIRKVYWRIEEQGVGGVNTGMGGAVQERGGGAEGVGRRRGGS